MTKYFRNDNVETPKLDVSTVIKFKENSCRGIPEI